MTKDEYTERSEAFLNEYIKRGEVLKKIDELVYASNVYNDYNTAKAFGWIEGRGRAALAVITTPPADVVEVVRCKDCRHKMTDEILLALAKNKDTALFCERMGGVISEMFYCGAGERMDGEDL